MTPAQQAINTMVESSTFTISSGLPLTLGGTIWALEAQLPTTPPVVVGAALVPSGTALTDSQVQTALADLRPLIQ